MHFLDRRQVFLKLVDLIFNFNKGGVGPLDLGEGIDNALADIF